MECKDCCESINGEPGNSACQQCLAEKEYVMPETEQCKAYGRMINAMLDSIFEMTKGNYK